MKENEMIGKHLDLARELKKQWGMEVTVIPLGAVLKKTGGIGNQKNQNHSDYSIVKIY